MKKIIGMTLAAVLFTAIGYTFSPTVLKNSMNKEKAVALLDSIETGDQTAVGYVNPQKYIQHNLSVGDGLAGFGEVLQALPEGSAKVNVIRAFQDGDYVFTHTDYNFFWTENRF